MEATFILTAELDADSFAWLDGLRLEHFPPERNFLPAHLTLFHRLSCAQIARLYLAELPDKPMPILFDAPIPLGFGVAVRICSSGLNRVREAVGSVMGGEFSRQDRQPWRPHVTIQNKVTASTAQQLHRALERSFAARKGSVTGLLVWEYLGGPWESVRRLPFN